MGIMGIFLRRRRRDGVRADRERGLTAERKVLTALQRTTRPAWILDVRPATENEDHRGIDVVVTTDRGILYLQVKSSETGARKEAAKRESLGDRATQRVRTIVVRPEHGLNEVYGLALGALILLIDPGFAEVAKSRPVERRASGPIRTDGRRKSRAA